MWPLWWLTLHLMLCKFLGFCICSVEVCILLGCSAASLVVGVRHIETMWWSRLLSSKCSGGIRNIKALKLAADGTITLSWNIRCWAPLTQWRGATLQNDSVSYVMGSFCKSSHFLAQGTANTCMLLTFFVPGICVDNAVENGRVWLCFHVHSVSNIHIGFSCM
jgi:hypothetical protein